MTAQSGENVERWRKKPVVIEAIKYDPPHNCAAVAQFVGDDDPGCSDYAADEGHTAEQYAIHTLEGVMWASPGDWVIKGVQGEFYPCKPDIFDATYERADSGSNGDPR